jgi:TolB-like protein/Tfp pilus assembly protein PilF
MALVAAALLIWVGSGWRARAASGEVRSLVVLPLTDLAPENGHEWFCDGLTEETIDALTRVPGLHVTAPESAFALKGQAGDSAAIGQQLGVSAVVRGTVRQTGGRVHIELNMERAADGYHLWSASFDRPADDLFAVPQALAEAIAGRIRLPFPKQPAARHRPTNEAYQAYLQGRDRFDRSAPQDLDKAAERLEEATRLDPEFVSAWAWLAMVREYRVASGKARPNQAMPGSRDAAERSVALDPDCGDGHLALGIVKLQYDWDWAGAKEELDRAVAARPGSAFALQWRAHWYETQGRMEEAMAEMQRAAALDPLSSALLSDVAAQYLAMNQPDRALPFAQKAADLAPDNAEDRTALADVLLLAGQKDKSRQMAEAGNLPPADRASLAAQLGDPGAARQLLDEAEDLPDEELMPAVAYAGLAASIQDWDRFFSWVAEADGERDVQLPYLRLSPGLPKSDPRFADYLARMNLPATASK